jgi:glycosyltransferase involved in cell wall biosynthesis
MKLSLIICTYQRPEATATLLESVGQQTIYPDQILLIDGSKDDETLFRFRESEIPNLRYYKVNAANRGLTRQRNFGIERVHEGITIVAFLDDDVILEYDYFEQLLEIYRAHPQAVGAGGYITNEVRWEKVSKSSHNDLQHFYVDGYRRQESTRFKLRRRLGLAPEIPAKYPSYGHGRSISFLPPSGKIYTVDQLMGGVSSFPKTILDRYKFSEYFEGYGLYEDAHYTLQLAKIGQLYVNTAARLEHHHDPAGRPNLYAYGRMVARNGWLVWRTHNPTPSLQDRSRWWMISLLLAGIRLINIFTSSDRAGAFQEFRGRMVGLISIILNKPKA